MCSLGDDTVKLYIGGISPDWSSERIKEILSKFGKVLRVDLVKNFAFAFVENQAAADEIIKQSDGKTFDGNKLAVQISKNKQYLPNADGDVCFECGKPGHWAKECTQRRRRLGDADRSGRSGGSRGYRDGPPPPRGGSGRDYPSERSSYDRFPPASSRERDPRDPYAREYEARALDRALYARSDPYASRDPYARDLYARDPYARDPYSRDPYVRDHYARSYDRYETARASYRERSPTAYRRPISPPPRASYPSTDPYAANRERLAYGRSVDPYDVRADQYDAARRALDAVRAASRAADPYSQVPARDHYAGDSASQSEKRYPDTAAYASRP